MTKTQLIERYRACYATDTHLDKAVELGILTSEEAESLKAERKNEGGIVKKEDIQRIEKSMEEISSKVDEEIVDNDYRLLMLESTI